MVLDNIGEIDSFIVSPLAVSGPANAGNLMDFIL